MQTRGSKANLIPRIDWANLIFQGVTPGDVLNWIENYDVGILSAYDSRGYAPIHWVSRFGKLNNKGNLTMRLCFII